MNWVMKSCRHMAARTIPTVIGVRPRFVTQTPMSLTDGGVSYPASGEIDLMKYYSGRRPADFYSRVVACGIDVKSLLWLARVAFDD